MNWIIQWNVFSYIITWILSISLSLKNEFCFDMPMFSKYPATSLNSYFYKNNSIWNYKFKLLNCLFNDTGPFNWFKQKIVPYFANSLLIKIVLFDHELSPKKRFLKLFQAQELVHNWNNFCYHRNYFMIILDLFFPRSRSYGTILRHLNLEKFITIAKFKASLPVHWISKVSAIRE